jgi:hypothetical protein
MDRHGYDRACPRNDDPAMESLPLLDFAAGYVLRAIERFPRQGARAPWRVYQNYALDRLTLRHSAVDDGVMRFSRSDPARAPR